MDWVHEGYKTGVCTHALLFVGSLVSKIFSDKEVIFTISWERYASVDFTLSVGLGVPLKLVKDGET